MEVIRSARAAPRRVSVYITPARRVAEDAVKLDYLLFIIFVVMSFDTTNKQSKLNLHFYYHSPRPVTLPPTVSMPEYVKINLRDFRSMENK